MNGQKIYAFEIQKYLFYWNQATKIFLILPEPINLDSSLKLLFSYRILPAIQAGWIFRVSDSASTLLVEGFFLAFEDAQISFGIKDSIARVSASSSIPLFFFVSFWIFTSISSTNKWWVFFPRCRIIWDNSWRRQNQKLSILSYRGWISNIMALGELFDL